MQRNSAGAASDRGPVVLRPVRALGRHLVIKCLDLLVSGTANVTVTIHMLVHNVTSQVSSVVFHNVASPSRGLKWAVTSPSISDGRRVSYERSSARFARSMDRSRWRRRGRARRRRH